MTVVYEDLVQIILSKGYGYLDDFLPYATLQALNQQFDKWYEADVFRQAAIGDKFNKKTVEQIRNDQIYWLNRTSESLAVQQFISQIDGLADYLNQTCFAGIVDHEFHFAVYDPGSFYKRHSDQFNQNDSRKFSLVLYLNDSWQKGDGGELVIYQDGTHEIAPVYGRTVFFKSEIEHEVLTSNFRRKSITGWLKTR